MNFLLFSGLDLLRALSTLYPLSLSTAEQLGRQPSRMYFPIRLHHTASYYSVQSGRWQYIAYLVSVYCFPISVMGYSATCNKKSKCLCTRSYTVFSACLSFSVL